MPSLETVFARNLLWIEVLNNQGRILDRNAYIKQAANILEVDDYEIYTKNNLIYFSRGYGDVPFISLPLDNSMLTKDQLEDIYRFTINMHEYEELAFRASFRNEYLKFVYKEIIS